MKFPTYEEWGEKVAEQAIDAYTINGRTMREWIEILSDELTMLDKIRAEIIDTGAYEQETKGETEFLKGINYCLSVFDKYIKGEQKGANDGI